MRYNYTEYFVEYDNENLIVYVSGLTKENFWEDVTMFEDVDNPESFAHGYVESLKKSGEFASSGPVVYEDN